MTENAPTSENSEFESSQKSYDDQSIYVRQKLTSLMQKDELFAINASGLYIVMPGKTYSGSTFVDKGCRGGWSESYKATLTEEPTKIASLNRSRDTVQVQFEGGGTTGLRLEDIPRAKFLSDPELWQGEMPTSEINDIVHDLLHTQAFTSHTYDELDSLTDWQHTVHVRASKPLEHPISYKQRASHGSVEIHPLPGDFERIDTYLDSTTDTVMARIIISEGKRSEATATSWVPLEQLDFYEKELPDYIAYEIRVGQLATALLRGESDTAAINQLLQSSPSTYHIGYRSTPNNSRTEQIVVGRSNGHSIENISAVPIEKPDYFHYIGLAATRVVYDHDHPWVTNQNGLSVPMLGTGQFHRDRSGSWFPHSDLESLIEQAKRYAE